VPVLDINLVFCLEEEYNTNVHVIRSYTPIRLARVNWFADCHVQVGFDIGYELVIIQKEVLSLFVHAYKLKAAFRVGSPVEVSERPMPL
jgi:hypothetical protein